MTDKKLNDNIIKKLYSSSNTDTIQALNEISEQGNSAYIPSLVDILRTNQENEIGDKTYKILSEIKHTDAVPALVKAIEESKNDPVQEALIRVCWENGLDFTNYFSTFIDLLINGEYMVAFEAYTVIDSSEGKISKTSLDEYLNTLKEAISNVAEDRQTLIHHTIQFLPSLLNQ